MTDFYRCRTVVSWTGLVDALAIVPRIGLCAIKFDWMFFRDLDAQGQTVRIRTTDTIRTVHKTRLLFEALAQDLQLCFVGDTPNHFA